MGYARLDFRLDKKTGKLFVLEINAQCGLSDDENYTSIGAILRMSDKTFTDLIVEVLDDALLRKAPVLNEIPIRKVAKRSTPALPRLRG